MSLIHTYIYTYVSLSLLLLVALKKLHPHLSVKVKTEKEGKVSDYVNISQEIWNKVHRHVLVYHCGTPLNSMCVN